MAIVYLAAYGEKVKDQAEAQKAGDFLLKAGLPANHVFYSHYHCSRAAQLFGGTTGRRRASRCSTR